MLVSAVRRGMRRVCGAGRSVSGSRQRRVAAEHLRRAGTDHRHRGRSGRFLVHRPDGLPMQEPPHRPIRPRAAALILPAGPGSAIQLQLVECRHDPMLSGADHRRDGRRAGPPPVRRRGGCCRATAPVNGPWPRTVGVPGPLSIAPGDCVESGVNRDLWGLSWRGFVSAIMAQFAGGITTSASRRNLTTSTGRRTRCSPRLPRPPVPGRRPARAAHRHPVTSPAG